MKNVIVRWCDTNAKDFEDFAPLRLMGHRNKKLGYSNDMHLLIIQGFEKLSDAYKQSLSDLGYTVHDVGKIYDEVEEKYYQLRRFTDYEKKCFLRWPVIHKIFPGEKIVHYDADIVLNEDPAIIAKKLEGKTFMLQGSPAFTVINDLKWFDQYNKELDSFTNDIEGYSADAWNQRDGWQVTFRTRWAGARFKKIISSDQDFLSHLVHTGKIIQEPVESVMFALNDYIVFDMPLFLHLYDDGAPFTYKRENGIDYFLSNRQDDKQCFSKKRVLFWHMQSTFNFVLSKFIIRRRLLPFFMFNRLSPDFAYKTLEKRVIVRLRRFIDLNKRSYVCDYFFNKKDFSQVFTPRMWWRRGVFEE